MENLSGCFWFRCLNNAVFKVLARLNCDISPWTSWHVCWQAPGPSWLLSRNISSLPYGSFQLSEWQLASQRASEPEGKRWKPKRQQKKKKRHYFCNLIIKATSHYWCLLFVRSQQLGKAHTQREASNIKRQRSLKTILGLPTYLSKWK